MESIVYVYEFARYGLKSYILIATWDSLNKCYAFTINKLKDGHLRRSVTVPFEVMTVMLNRINHVMDSLRQHRAWLSRMALDPLAGKFYELFCIPVYAHGAHEWSVSVRLRVSDHRVYIGLHEMEPHTDGGPKAMYLHNEAFFHFIDSLDQATTEVANHPGTHQPIGGGAFSLDLFEQSVSAALAQDA